MSPRRIGQMLKARREALKLTREQLAKKAHATTAYFSMVSRPVLQRFAKALGVLVVAGGCASGYNAAQWRAHDAFQGCLRSLGSQVGENFVSFSATKDGTLYYGPFRQSAAEAKFAECLRTRYPDVNAIAGAGPR